MDEAKSRKFFNLRTSKIALLTCFILETVTIFYLRTNLIYGYSASQVQIFETNLESSGSSRFKSCKPADFIFFLKTHKTGSSTVMNILNRYGLKNGLKIALPDGKLNRFGYPDFVDPKYFSNHPDDPWEKLENPAKFSFNIVDNHMRYNHNKKIDDYLFTKSDISKVKKITILREPVSLMLSTFNYISDAPAFKRSGSLRSFIENPQAYYDSDPKNSKPVSNNVSKISLEHAHFAHNHMAFDLGYSSENVDSFKLKKIISEVERQYHLVMLQDRFDESLILLKELLCLDVSDILYVIKNKSQKYPKAVRLVDEGKVRTWNQVDSALYDHFSKILDQKIKLFGELRMNREIENLRSKNNEIYKKCISGTKVQSKSSKFSFVPKNSKIMRYRLKESMIDNSECKNLVRSSLDFLHMLRLIQV